MGERERRSGARGRGRQYGSIGKSEWRNPVLGFNSQHRSGRRGASIAEVHPQEQTFLSADAPYVTRVLPARPRVLASPVRPFLSGHRFKAYLPSCALLAVRGRIELTRYVWPSDLYDHLDTADFNVHGDQINTILEKNGAVFRSGGRLQF